MRYKKLFKYLFLTAFLLGTTNVVSASISTDAKLQYNKGIDYYQVGQFEQAADCFKQAVELDPNYIDAYYNLGSIWEYLNKDEAALSVFKQIILRKPDDSEAVFKAANLSYKLGYYEKAKMYLSLIPKNSMISAQVKQLEADINTKLQAAAQNQSNNDENKTSQYVSSNNTEQNENYMVQPNPEPSAQTSVPAGTKYIYKDISSPTGVAADKSLNLYIAGFSDNTIYKIDSNNTKIVYLKNEKIDGPIGIAMDLDNNLYIANYNKNNVLKFDINGELSEFIKDVDKPYCVYVLDNYLYVSCQGSNSVVKYKIK